MTRDVTTLDAFGLLEGLDVSRWVADRRHIGRGMIAPPRKPSESTPTGVTREVSRNIIWIRYIVKRVNAHIHTWKILKEDY
ncbi:hypothetical protein [Actinomyces oris]|uniref:hypothetical protein n=1 Tax=Actinomyces oris TaxID=544580 RepID=UPI00094CE4DF|nr:hypothetical protein [Actinomyces oris]OLO56289.1 hypothetical protein BKH26_06255 [Actinomyces oris]OLO56939.1 hypothetical protein BKH24_13765 [Actinomyces oris]